MREKRQLGDSDRRLSPILAGFQKFPRTIIYSAGCDFLRFENKIAAEQMKLAGVQVIHRVWENQPHGFLVFPKHQPAADAMKQMMVDLVDEV